MAPAGPTRSSSSAGPPPAAAAVAAAATLLLLLPKQRPPPELLLQARYPRSRWRAAASKPPASRLNRRPAISRVRWLPSDHDVGPGRASRQTKTWDRGSLRGKGWLGLKKPAASCGPTGVSAEPEDNTTPSPEVNTAPSPEANTTPCPEADSGPWQTRRQHRSFRHTADTSLSQTSQAQRETARGRRLASALASASLSP